MAAFDFIYIYNYNYNERELCELETKYIFNEELTDKSLLSNIKVEPSCSTFIKKRLDVLMFSEDYKSLINQIKEARICVEGFKAEYVVLSGDLIEYDDRLKRLRDVGMSINGNPDYCSPTITYGLACDKGVWYFGTLIKDDFSWHKHKQKPRSFSNSITVPIAKALLNIASGGNTDTPLLDVCCGAGTIMLEACFNGYNIEGNDINEKMCRHTKENLSFFGYSAEIHHSDIKDLNKTYESGIVDLPYNLFSVATDDDLLSIIQSTANRTKRQVIVSTKDISGLIKQAGLELIDYCKIDKRGKVKFGRQIWVCEQTKI